MTSWYSNILTKTTSQISSLRTTLLSGEADGDTEDDTHVCRVLRHYYAEKGRPLPQWLPPDPKAPAPAPQPLYAQSQVGSRYGGLGQQQGPGAGGGGLSSLWDNPPAAQKPPPQSLRAGRQAPPTAGGGGGMYQQQQQQQQPPLQRGREEIQPRPLPSQRAGSHQVGVAASPAASGGGGSSAQDRLRQRLRGGRTGSPTSGGQGPTQPPAPQRGGNSYDDRFAQGGGQYETGTNQPYMGSNAPWAGGGLDDYSGSYGGGGGGDGRSGSATRRGGGGGLPSGPRAYR